MPPIVLDRISPTPLHHQIRNQIAQAIRAGTVAAGTRLPSTRLLARLLGVSRNTAFSAYEDLAADDLIRGERGLGMRVTTRYAEAGRSWVGIGSVIAEAHYPARVLALEDADGNAFYVRF